MGDSLVFSAAMMMGLFSAPHCLGMCGGLLSAFTINSGNENVGQKLLLVVKLNLGRLVSYTLLGLIAGGFGSIVVENLPGSFVGFRVLAGLLIVLSGFYIAGWWLGLRHLEQWVGQIWHKLQSGNDYNAKTGWFTGLAWGCLPCGLVYSALSIALTQSDIVAGGLFMLSFGLGTLPVLICVGLMSAQFPQWLRNQWVRGGSGTLMIIYGVWTMAAPFYQMH